MKRKIGCLYSPARILLILALIFPIIVIAQNQNSISSIQVKEHFNAFNKADARLVSGDFYQTPQMSDATGNPFFIDANWKTGSVTLNSVTFENLSLRYDIDSHRVILNTVNLTDSYIQIVLKKDELSEFMLGDEKFVSYPNIDPVDGKMFAHAMVSGSIDFWVVKSKNLKVTAGGISDYVYQTNTRKSLRYNNKIISYKGVRTLQKLLPQYKLQINTFLKDNKLRYRRKDLDQHASIIHYCNQLIQSGA